MPATRLLLIADSKMLPALANGLREGSRFDVLTVPLSDAAGAQAAAEKADAVALFYGAPGAPLPAALQALAAKVRDRGGRVVAVLQREQAAQRDDCFRAGASDLLFMPQPKDQFVARLQGSLELAWPQEGGAPAPVAVATRTASSRIDAARVSAAGVEASAELPLKPGETVRLSWGTFQSWGLVVRGGPSAQIRFAGLAPDEEAQIRGWVKKGAAPAAAAAPPAGTAAAGRPTPPGGTAVVPPAPVASTGAIPAAAPTGAMPTPASTGAMPTPAGSEPVAPAGARAAPVGGPPPGFADRKPVRPQTQTRPPVRAARPAASAPAPAAAPSGPAPVAIPTPAQVSAAPAVPAVPVSPPAAAPAGNGSVGAAFFDEAESPADQPVEGGPSAPAGPPWPVPVSPAACKAVAMQLLKDKAAPADAAPALLAAARKITSMLGSAERAVLEKGGPDSYLGDAVAARIALDAATSEGVQLYSSAAAVDAAAVAALTRQADEAAARLQKEANAAVGKGQLESLQMVTAASAALSRDLLNFRATADRLRGQSAAPRLGAGALDPEVVLPGQAPRPKPLPSTAVPVVKAELRDFEGLEERSGRGKGIIAALIIAGAVAAAVNGFYFGLPQRSEISVATAGEGISRIDVSGDAAMVTVTPEWVAHAEARVHLLASVLRERGVKKAILMLPNGSTSGVLDVTTGKLIGAPKPPPK